MPVECHSPLSTQGLKCADIICFNAAHLVSGCLSCAYRGEEQSADHGSNEQAGQAIP